ncbi:MAG: hypothetical protein ACYDDF_03585 [Thermoplasmatota archaeon]
MRTANLGLLSGLIVMASLLTATVAHAAAAPLTTHSGSAETQSGNPPGQTCNGDVDHSCTKCSSYNDTTCWNEENCIVFAEDLCPGVYT